MSNFFVVNSFYNYSLHSSVCLGFCRFLTMNQMQSVNGKRPVQATRFRDDRTQTAQQDELIRFIYECMYLVYDTKLTFLPLSGFKKTLLFFLFSSCSMA